MSGHWLPGPGARLIRSQSGRVAATGLGAGLAVFFSGTPYWCEHISAAVVACLACAAFATAGALLSAGGGTRRLTGRLLVAGAYCWPITWLIAWDRGITPTLSFFGQAGFVVCIGSAILSYPAGRLSALRERAWIAATIAFFVAGNVVLQLLSRPEWIGLSPSVSWPNVASSRAVFDAGSRGIALGQVVLAAWFATLLWLRARWLSRLDRRVAIPVLVAAALLGLVSSIQAVVQPQVWSNLGELESFYFTQGVIALAVAGALVSGALRDRWWELKAPHHVVRATSSGTSVATVRNALAEALRDDSLLLLFWTPIDREPELWLPAEDGWVDPSGRPGWARVAPGTDRWQLPIATADDLPLALIEVDAALKARPALVDAVLRAGTQALLTAQLQAAASAHLSEVMAAQARVIERELAERRRLEQDLHAGARQRLGLLARHLNELSGIGSAAYECRDEVLATIGELDALARGLLPEQLRHDGLELALRAVADRLPLRTRFTVCAGRFPPAVEETVYFALCEGLTNAAKHAPDATVSVRAAVDDGWLTASITDDGPGGAVIVPGGGLAGIEDRAKALDGWATLESSPGAGTELRLSVPTAEWRPGTSAHTAA